MLTVQMNPSKEDLEKLLDTLYGEGWENLTISDARHFQVICKYCGYPVGSWRRKVTGHCIHVSE